jgi:hypothetical protein
LLLILLGLQWLLLLLLVLWLLLLLFNISDYVFIVFESEIYDFWESLCESFKDARIEFILYPLNESLTEYYPFELLD